jgi:hypothetical protein
VALIVLGPGWGGVLPRVKRGEPLFVELPNIAEPAPRGQPTGLSLIGEPVVLAFRLEKFATDATGPILTCPVTKLMASQAFTFRDLGTMHAKGFDQPDHVFALEGARHSGPEGAREPDR